MSDKQITPFQLTDQFTMDNFNQRINETNIALQSKPNPNLLDNWYFSNPVDQRGGYVYPPNSPYADRNGNQIGMTSQYLTIDKSKKSPFSDDWAEISIDGTTYYGYITYAVRGYAGAGYGIDRWIANNPYTVLIKDGYLQLISGVQNGFYSQPLDGIFAKLSGKTVTMSVLAEVISGEAYLNVIDGNSVLKKITNGLTSVTKTIISAPTEDRAVIYATEGAVINVYAAKLELGTTQTLAHQENGNWVLNEIPDYGEQLRRCQMYRMQYGLHAQWVATQVQTDYIDFSIYLPVSMRKAPSIEGASYLRVYNQVGNVSADDFTFSVVAFSGNNVRVRAVKTNHGYTSAVLEAAGAVAFVDEL